MQIDWGKAPDDAMYAAKDINGGIHYFESKPYFSRGYWLTPYGDIWREDDLEVGFGVKPEDSLQERPQ